MLSTILNAFQVADIRKKLLFTAAMLLIYRFGAHVPVPGVEPDGGEQHPESFGGGGILELPEPVLRRRPVQTGVFALGIMPYITSSIILQLLQVVVPSLEKLPKEGEVGPGAHHPVHALPDRRPRVRAVDRLRVPVPQPAGAAGETVITNFDVPHIFLIVIASPPARAAHVDRRADHRSGASATASRC